MRNFSSVFIFFFHSESLQTISGNYRDQYKTIVGSIFSKQPLEDFISRLRFRRAPLATLRLSFVDNSAHLQSPEVQDKDSKGGDHPWDHAGSCAASIFGSMIPCPTEASSQTARLLYREQANLKAVLPPLSKSTWACRLHGHARPICDISLNYL